MYEEPGGKARPCADPGERGADPEAALGTVAAVASPAPRLISPAVLRWVGALLVAVLAISLGFLAVRFAPRLAELATYGYVGVFALMAISGGSILFPVPGMAGVFAAGMVWNPLLVGLAAGLGNSVGEMTGYIAGRSGRTLINADERPFFQRADRYLRRFGFPALVVFAAIPNPVFDVVGLVAGCLGYSAKRFWIACAIGNTVKYTVLAYIGVFASTLF